VRILQGVENYNEKLDIPRWEESKSTLAFQLKIVKGRGSVQARDQKKKLP